MRRAGPRPGPRPGPRLPRAAAGASAAGGGNAPGGRGFGPGEELKKLQKLDALIGNLLAAQGPEARAKIVAEQVLEMDQAFWMRIATRADGTADPKEREALSQMSTEVMYMVDNLVKSTNQQTDTKVPVLQEILAAAANEQGEWYLPLADGELEAMRAALMANFAEVDEAFLGTVYAWLRKCTEDSMNEMVGLLQALLQLYAAQVLSHGGTGEGATGALNRILGARVEEWDALAAEAAAGSSEEALGEEIQKKMESTVIALPSGSNTQRVYAEYLMEAQERIKEAFAARKAAADDEGAA